MDTAEAMRIARNYVDSLKMRCQVEDAVLFGSFARGTHHDDSDIDIAIVLTNIHDIIDTQIDLMKLRRKIDLRIEPHPFERKDFNATNPVVHEILKHGIRIYDKAA